MEGRGEAELSSACIHLLVAYSDKCFEFLVLTSPVFEKTISIHLREGENNTQTLACDKDRV